jgi:hypothetical protein
MGEWAAGKDYGPGNAFDVVRLPSEVVALGSHDKKKWFPIFGRYEGNEICFDQAECFQFYQVILPNVEKQGGR